MDAEKVGGKLIVGQESCRDLLHAWQANNTFPHFLLIVGDEGSGRKTLSYLFAQLLNSQIAVITDISAESVRNVVESSYSIDSKLVYLFPDADKMSAAAKNSLLKFTEEPPKNAYIVMTLTSLEHTLHTLQSRSQHLVLAPYTKAELSQLSEDDRLVAISTTPGMLYRLEAMKQEDVDAMIDTAKKIIGFIDKVSVANALKSASSIKFKDTDTGTDFDLILATLNYLMSATLSKPAESLEYAQLLRIKCWANALGEWGRKFSYTGVNKKAIYDQFILDVRSRLQKVGDGSGTS